MKKNLETLEETRKERFKMEFHLIQFFFALVLILSALGVILLPKPVHASLSFLSMLLALSFYYIQLSAQFIAVMQILVYAGAILVIFMYVIILFQDAHQNIEQVKPQSYSPLLTVAGVAFSLILLFIGKKFFQLPSLNTTLPEDYGTVQALGKALYIDYFFPFEAVILLFLVAVVGALYTGRKGA